ncbi:MAG: D-alanyl-D-alanine carboxypeptidase, partial [Oscillospiraceae bacterium]|nr:D-alanyl-D-alanine carboxypeptidase [Oscillospiraceae bacterium]
YAASMGGSQVFLEEGEHMSVRDMLKSIVVASANDAAVAMAEYLAGSESAFVARMNARAADLGMTNTTFKNCTGLLDDTEHLTTARDIAAMSRELISHDMIKEYTTIWMDTVRGGQFGLTNTNKLVRFYDGATGLKTGFTSRSMYCLSATAERGGVEYIAVVLHGKTSAERFEDAKTLLNYAFANCALVSASPDEPLPPVRVKLGKTKTVQPVIEGCGGILTDKASASAAEKTVELPDTVTAPVSAGQKLGTLTVTSGGKTLGVFDVTAGDEVSRLTWLDIFTDLLRSVFG